jgi:hypothetical protein
MTQKHSGRNTDSPKPSSHTARGRVELPPISCHATGRDISTGVLSQPHQPLDVLVRWLLDIPVKNMPDDMLIDGKGVENATSTQLLARKTYQLALGAIASGGLKDYCVTSRRGDNYILSVVEFVDWAEGKGFAIPEGLAAARTYFAGKTGEASGAESVKTEGWLTHAKAARRYVKGMSPLAVGFENAKSRISKAYSKGLKSTGKGKTRRIDPQSLDAMILRDRDRANQDDADVDIDDPEDENDCLDDLKRHNRRK